MGEFRSDCGSKPIAAADLRMIAAMTATAYGNTYFISCPLFSVLRE